MLDWSKLPDAGAVTLLALAFRSVARRRRTQASAVWLAGWLLIAVHFLAFIFAPAPALTGTTAEALGLATLAWAGILFMWAAVPFRNDPSSRRMVGILLSVNTLYLSLLCTVPNTSWLLIPAALLYGILPTAVTLAALRRIHHPARWSMTILNLCLAIFLLIVQGRPSNGAELALNGVLFTVYFGCSLHFALTYRRVTTGTLITIAGFSAWAAVFVAAPSIAAFLPQVRLESGVWNLPKYVVAVGMILLVLEEQIEHNQYLALHDELTGLPNRRLFRDRLTGALERARRNGTEAALLLVDLDRFKEVNDTAGHHVGDLLLRHVSDLFLGRVRRSDTVARTGGDEFSLILEEPVSRQDAEQIGQSLAQSLREPIRIGPHRVEVGASVGVAVYPGDGSTCEALCIAADRAMYAKKHASRERELRPLDELGLLRHAQGN